VIAVLPRVARLAGLACASTLLACGGDDSTSPTNTTSTSTGTGGASTGGSSTGGSNGGSATGGSGGSGAQGGAAIDYCTACTTVTVAGTVQRTQLVEASGLAASALHTDTLYANNDSGDTPRFFALGLDGSARGTFDVTNATAIDWEDMSRGPCPAGSCVFLADIGDNAEARTTYTIYRVTEPAAVDGDSTAAADAFPFEYPDGSHNAETFLVEPQSGQMFIVTKVFAGPSSIYEFPAALEPDTMSTLTKIGELEPPDGSPLFTGGDIHPAGHGVLLRTYNRLWFYPKTESQSLADALTGTPCSLPVADEPQGETVAWTSDAASYVTISEGSSADVNVVSCAP
jgi:hypothetical protein